MASIDLKKNQSVWAATESMPKFTKLNKNLNVDVCIIGGGIAGLTSAYLLMKEGKTVCVLEAFELASGQTSRTTAHFTTALDDRYFEIEKYLGEHSARLAGQSHRAAIDRVEKIVQDEKIKCEIEKVSGYLFAGDQSRLNIVQKEFEITKRIGLAVEFVEGSPLTTFDTGPCLKFSDQLQLHPLKYLLGISKYIASHGGHIFTNTHVNETHGGQNAYVKTDNGHIVHCQSIIVATNTPINDRFAIHTKQAPYRTYVVGFQIPKGGVPRGLYWDTFDPYHYIRTENFGPNDILIVGGEDHKTGQDSHPEERFENLDTWTRERFPMATKILYQWSGQVMEPVDSLAYLGRNPGDEKNVYIITGDSGNGMTHCTIGGMIITDLIMGRTNPWERLYDPSRISVRATPEFIKENANVAAQYADWFSVKSKPDFANIDAGTGLVYRDGLKMIAAYKNESGNVECMSAACPHLGGVVQWNNVEKSWDCPCHGSRFDSHGKVIEGPAISDLKKIDKDRPQEASQ